MKLKPGPLQVSTPGSGIGSFWLRCTTATLFFKTLESGVTLRTIAQQLMIAHSNWLHCDHRLRHAKAAYTGRMLGSRRDHSQYWQQSTKQAWLLPGNVFESLPEKVCASDFKPCIWDQCYQFAGPVISCPVRKQELSQFKREVRYKWNIWWKWASCYAKGHTVSLEGIEAIGW